MPLDLRDQYFGCEVEMTGLTREAAARALAELFGTSARLTSVYSNNWAITDQDGKEWKIVSDGSIDSQVIINGRRMPAGSDYKVEMNSPILEYSEMPKLQLAIRALSNAGGLVNKSCGMHVHIDASKHTPRSLRNVLSIMYSKEDILFAALKTNPSRVDRWCRKVDDPVLKAIRKLPGDATMEQLKDRWYQGEDRSNIHRDYTRYHALYVQKTVIVE